jgi:putative endonuclease
VAYYVYILKSHKDGTYYKGSSESYLERFAAHNRGESRYTKDKIPWELIYAEEHPDKKSALIRERKLKKCKADYFEWLRKSGKNLISIEPPCHGPG